MPPPPQEKVLRPNSKMDCLFHPHPPTFKQYQNLTGGHTNSVIVEHYQLAVVTNMDFRMIILQIDNMLEN